MSQYPIFYNYDYLFGYKLFIPLPDSLRAKEQLRLQKEEEKLLKLITTTQTKLAQEEFLAKAPPEIVAKLQNTLTEAESKLQDLRQKC